MVYKQIQCFIDVFDDFKQNYVVINAKQLFLTVELFIVKTLYRFL